MEKYGDFVAQYGKGPYNDELILYVAYKGSYDVASRVILGEFVRNKDGDTQFHYALFNSDPRVLQMMIDLHDEMPQNNSLMTPLDIAVTKGLYDVTKLLIDNYNQFTYRKGRFSKGYINKEKLAIHYSLEGSKYITNLLLSHPSAGYIKSIDTRKLIEFCIINKYNDQLDLLLYYIGPLDIGSYLLRLAYDSDNTGAFELILDSGVSPSINFSKDEGNRYVSVRIYEYVKEKKEFVEILKSKPGFSEELGFPYDKPFVDYIKKKGDVYLLKYETPEINIIVNFNNFRQYAYIDQNINLFNTVDIRNKTLLETYLLLAQRDLSMDVVKYIVGKMQKNLAVLSLISAFEMMMVPNNKIIYLLNNLGHYEYTFGIVSNILNRIGLTTENMDTVVALQLLEKK